MSAFLGVGVCVSAPFVIAGGIFAACYYRDGVKGAWRRLRIRALGGVTTLERKLSYNCAMCQYSMDAREMVRTLSCNHVFHCGDSDKCEGNIDGWLRTQPTMVCPVCRETPRPVLPWRKAPPPEPAPSSSSSSGAEDTAPAQSSSDLEDPPQPSPTQSSPDLEDPPQSPPALEEPLLPRLQ